jgi:hypothetical protein
VRSRANLSGILAAAVVLLAGFAEAATVKVLSPGALADRSVVVFVGTVSGEESRFVSGPDHVVTETTFAVSQVVKGSVGSTYVLTQLGGVVGEGAARRGTAVPGYARFSKGERVVLFLEPTSSGRLVPTGLAQGKYRVIEEGGATLAVRDLGDLHLVGFGPQRHLLGAPQDPNRLALSVLLAIVAGERPSLPVPLVRRPEAPAAPGGGEVAR